MNMTGPAIKMPAEGAFNRSFYSGAPISDYKEWAVSGLLGAPGRVAWPSFTGGERAVAPAWVGFAAGPRPFAVGQREQRSEYKRREDLVDTTIRQLRQKEADRRFPNTNVGPNSKVWSKITTKEIEDLKRWKKAASKSVGATGFEPLLPD
jgi:hypothetical protein